MLQTLVLCRSSFERTYYRMWPGEYETWPGLVHDCIHPRHNLILPCPSIAKPCLAQNNGVLCYFFAPKLRVSRNYTLSGPGIAHRKRRPQLGFDVLAAVSISRIGRDILGVLQIGQELSQCGKGLCLVKEDICTLTDALVEHSDDTLEMGGQTL